MSDDRINRDQQGAVVRDGTETAGDLAIGKGQWEGLRRWLGIARNKPIGAVSLAVLLILGTMAIFAPYVGTTDIYAKDSTALLQAPSSKHWFGTDELGRDFYTQVLYGSRSTLLVALLAVAFGSAGGLIAGVASGYLGGWVETAVQRTVDVMLAFPTIILALSIIAILGQGIDKVILAIALVEGPRLARIIRGNVLSLKEFTYIDAARAVGASPLRIMLRHILPGTMPTYLIMFTAYLGGAVLLEASLSFLGMGIPPPTPSWGRFLSGNIAGHALSSPWLVIIPGVAITLLVLAFNLFGDTLRDVWDPRLRGR